MDGFKKWLLTQESYGTLGGVEPPKQDPGGLSSDDTRKGRGSALDVSRHPELDKEPPQFNGSPTKKSSKFVKDRENDVLKFVRKYLKK